MNKSTPRAVRRGLATTLIGFLRVAPWLGLGATVACIAQAVTGEPTGSSAWLTPFRPVRITCSDNPLRVVC
jgi:hypothetical protein